jgi:hypothetical protein
MPASDIPRADPVHPLWLRLTHWLNAAAVFIMAASGWRIYNASPLFGFTIPAGLTARMPEEYRTTPKYPCRHSGARRNPVLPGTHWVPACAGTTRLARKRALSSPEEITETFVRSLCHPGRSDAGRLAVRPRASHFRHQHLPRRLLGRPGVQLVRWELTG